VVKPFPPAIWRVCGAARWGGYIDRWRMTSFLLWSEPFVNHNQELFSQIQEEQRKISDYVDDKFVPEFLHAMIAAGD